MGRGIALKLAEQGVRTCVALLCSEQAGWITGQIIYADGGVALMSPEVPPEIQLSEEQGMAHDPGA